MDTRITRGSHRLRLHRTAGTALITTCCAGRQPLLADPVAAATVLESLQWLNAVHRLLLHVAVVMPDHLHFVADPLGGDWQSLLRTMKSFTANAIAKRLHHACTIWQTQYHDRRIDSDAQLAAAIEYCLLNPVRAGLVPTASEWPHSWLRGS